MCSSPGMDCCAPWNEKVKESATCFEGYLPVRSPYACQGNRNGLYSCCPPVQAFKSCSGTCDIGKYAVGPTVTECSDCPNGQIQDREEASEYNCRGCASGRFPSEAKDACDECSDGQYVAGDSCAACGPGTFAVSKNGVGTKTCRSKQPNIDDSWCNLNCNHIPPNCSPDNCACELIGVVSGGADNVCRSCEPGMFQPDDVSTAYACHRCPEGFVQNKRGMTFCDKCEIGQYADAKALDSCKTCDSGRSTAFSGWPIPCITCGKGMRGLGGELNMTEQMKTVARLQMSTQYATDLNYLIKVQTFWCTPCQEGMYQELTNFAGHRCNFCPKGKKFVSQTTTCQDCLQGKTQPSDTEAGAACHSCGKGQCELQVPGYSVCFITRLVWLLLTFYLTNNNNNLTIPNPPLGNLQE